MLQLENLCRFFTIQVLLTEFPLNFCEEPVNLLACNFLLSPISFEDDSDLVVAAKT